MRTNSSHTSIMRAIEFSFIIMGIRELVYIYLELHEFTFIIWEFVLVILWELLVKDMRAPIWFLLGEASVSARTLLFIIGSDRQFRTRSSKVFACQGMRNVVQGPPGCYECVAIISSQELTVT